MHGDLAQLPPATLAVLVVAGLAQVGLMVVSLVVCLKTEEARLTLPRLAWLAIVVLVGFAGPLAFLVVGRRAGAQPAAQAASAASVAAAVGDLYGEGR